MIDDELYEYHRKWVCRTRFGQELLQVGLSPDQVQDVMLIYADVSTEDPVLTTYYLKQTLTDAAVPVSEKGRRRALELSTGRRFDRNLMESRDDSDGIPDLAPDILTRVCQAGAAPFDGQIRDGFAWDDAGVGWTRVAESSPPFAAALDKHREAVCLSDFGQVLLNAGFTPQQIQDTVVIHALMTSYELFGEDGALVDELRSACIISCLDECRVPELPAERQAALASAAGHSFDYYRVTVKPDPHGVPTLDAATSRHICRASFVERERERNPNQGDSIGKRWSERAQADRGSMGSRTPGGS